MNKKEKLETMNLLLEEFKKNCKSTYKEIIGLDEKDLPFRDSFQEKDLDKYFYKRMIEVNQLDDFFYELVLNDSMTDYKIGNTISYSIGFNLVILYENGIYLTLQMGDDVMIKIDVIDILLGRVEINKADEQKYELLGKIIYALLYFKDYEYLILLIGQLGLHKKYIRREKLKRINY